MKATISGRDERTLMKIVVQRSTDRVLGVWCIATVGGTMVVSAWAARAVHVAQSRARAARAVRRRAAASEAALAIGDLAPGASLPIG